MAALEIGISNKLSPVICKPVTYCVANLFKNHVAQGWTICVNERYWVFLPQTDPGAKQLFTGPGWTNDPTEVEFWEVLQHAYVDYGEAGRPARRVSFCIATTCTGGGFSPLWLYSASDVEKMGGAWSDYVQVVCVDRLDDDIKLNPECYGQLCIKWWVNASEGISAPDERVSFLRVDSSIGVVASGAEWSRKVGRLTERADGEALTNVQREAWRRTTAQVKAAMKSQRKTYEDQSEDGEKPVLEQQPAGK